MFTSLGGVLLRLMMHELLDYEYNASALFGGAMLV